MVKKLFGYFLVLLPSIVVLALWLVAAPLGSRLGTTQISLLSLGQITGLLGLSLFATSLYLNSRIKIFNYFLTTAQVCKLHHQLGSIGFILMLFHPLFLAIRYAQISVVLAANFLLPEHNLINLAGLVAIGLLSFMMLTTYYLVKYRFIWIWSHRLALLAYILSGLHLIFVTSDVSRYPALKYFLLAIMLAGIVGFTYQRLIYHYSQKPQPEAC
jgi:DMSO/TMAO reductase YedYZ heme-binding membrane subunit